MSLQNVSLQTHEGGAGGATSAVFRQSGIPPKAAHRGASDELAPPDPPTTPGQASNTYSLMAVTSTFAMSMNRCTVSTMRFRLARNFSSSPTAS